MNKNSMKKKSIYKKGFDDLLQKLSTPKGKKVLIQETYSRTKKCILTQKDIEYTRSLMFLFLYKKINLIILKKHQKKSNQQNSKMTDIEFMNNIKKRFKKKKRNKFSSLATTNLENIEYTEGMEDIEFLEGFKRKFLYK